MDSRLKDGQHDNRMLYWHTPGIHELLSQALAAISGPFAEPQWNHAERAIRCIVQHEDVSFFQEISDLHSQFEAGTFSYANGDIFEKERLRGFMRQAGVVMGLKAYEQNPDLPNAF